MAIDKPRSRTELKHEVRNRRTDMEKKINNAERVVKDKKIESRTAQSLRLEGTSDGANEVKKAVQHAGEVTDKEHQRQEKDLKAKVLDKARKLETDLGKRAQGVKQDIGKLKEAIGGIDTAAAKQGVKVAELGAQKDDRFLNETKREQEQDRTRGEAKIGKQAAEMKSTKVSFRS
jgi:hypothetical protein